MPENQPADENPKTEPAPPEPPEDDAGEFISRQVLDKDTVFFEG